ncbi:kinase-like protein [Paxillus ammoniavirescens]|nr:kinase-like protein [Paxillus ammoniavirescens]
MLHRELSVWARLENENILPFYGVAFGFGPLPALVCPWAANGTLHRYLTDHGDLNLMDRLKLLCDIANGLDYLHGQEVIHGDLTSANVLISAAGRASLSDFGLSTIHQEFLGTSYFTDSSRGHVRWAAPELFDPANRSAILNEKTDIYSFGSLMLQVCLQLPIQFAADIM